MYQNIKNDAFIGIRLPREEKEALEARAIEEGLTLTDLIKSCITGDRVGDEDSEQEPSAYPLLLIEYEEDLVILERLLKKMNERQKGNLKSAYPSLEVLLKSIIAKQLLQIGSGGFLEKTDEEMIELGKDWKY